MPMFYSKAYITVHIIIWELLVGAVAVNAGTAVSGDLPQDHLEFDGGKVERLRGDGPTRCYVLDIYEPRLVAPQLDRILSEFHRPSESRRIVTVCIVNHKSTNHDLHWVGRLDGVAAIFIEGKHFDSQVLEMLKPLSKTLEEIGLHLMIVRAKDLRHLKELPHVSSLYLDCCRLNGDVLRTLHKIGFQGTLRITSDQTLRREREYLRRHQRELPFQVFFDVPERGRPQPPRSPRGSPGNHNPFKSPAGSSSQTQIGVGRQHWVAAGWSG